MKNKIILLVLSFLALSSYAQESVYPQIGLSIYQDVNLALFEKDKGLNPWTTNITAKVKLFGYDNTDYGQLMVGLVYTYADLSDQWLGNLHRTSIEVGFNFAYMRIGKIKYQLTPSIGYGLLGRTKGNIIAQSADLSLEISFKLCENIRFNMLAVQMQRPELPDGPSSNNPFLWKSNVAVGFEYRFDVYEPTKRK